MGRTPEEMAKQLTWFEHDPPGTEMYARLVPLDDGDAVLVLRDVLGERAVAPPTAAELQERLHPLPGPVVRLALVELLSESLAYPGDGAEVADAWSLARDLTWLLGPAASWRTNIRAADPMTWNHVTECTFDGCLLGHGAGYVLVIVSTDED
jgi:hypothetical protein